VSEYKCEERIEGGNHTALLSGGRYMPMNAVTALKSIHNGLVLRPSCVPEKLGFIQKAVNQK
jgi:hypothetical protein